jgi:hypothetical protein
MPFTPADERRHPPGPDPWWQEAWVFELWTPDGLGAFTWLTLLPQQRRAWYWAVVVRPASPLLYLADVDVPWPREGLEIRSEGLWASHECEAPFEQWTVANEAYAVALDDPAEALARAYGRPEPVAFDLEWYASGAAAPLGAGVPAGSGGYRQDGTVSAHIELQGGRLEVEASGSRSHWWGSPPLAEPPAGLDDGGARVALAVGQPGAEVVHRALRDGWREWRTSATSPSRT